MDATTNFEPRVASSMHVTERAARALLAPHSDAHQPFAKAATDAAKIFKKTSCGADSKQASRHVAKDMVELGEATAEICKSVTRKLHHAAVVREAMTHLGKAERVSHAGA